MKQKIPMITRYILGFIFFASGISWFLNLAPPPTDMPEGLMTFMNGLIAAKYFLPLLKLTETFCGLLLLIGFAPALSLVILAPITVNIVFVHMFLTPGLENLILPVVIMVLHITTATKYWPVYKPLFQKNKSFV